MANEKEMKVGLPVLEVFDVRDHYDQVLVERFYNEVLKVAFPMESELDPLEVLTECVSTSPPPNEATSHIMMAVEGKFEDSSEAKIAGGIVFEYYPLSHSGLISYVVTSPAYRGKGIGRILMNHVLAKLNSKTAPAGFPCLPTLETHFRRQFTTFFSHHPLQNRPQQSQLGGEAKSAGPVPRIPTPSPFLPTICYAPTLLAAAGCGCGGGGCGGGGAGLGGGNQRVDGCGDCGRGGSSEGCIVFAETNKLGVEDGVLDPSTRHTILRSYGLQHLKMPYVQPALTDEQEPCFDLLLLGLTQDGSGGSLPAARIALFLEEYFSGCLDYGDKRRSGIWQEATYRDVLSALQITPSVSMVHEGPWEDVTLAHLLQAESA